MINPFFRNSGPFKISDILQLINLDDLNIDNEMVSFSARFSGKSTNIYLPIGAVTAIYSRENGHGMIFPEEDNDNLEQEVTSVVERKKTNLKLIK